MLEPATPLRSSSLVGGRGFDFVDQGAEDVGSIHNPKAASDAISDDEPLIFEDDAFEIEEDGNLVIRNPVMRSTSEQPNVDGWGVGAAEDMTVDDLGLDFGDEKITKEVSKAAD